MDELGAEVVIGLIAFGFILYELRQIGSGVSNAVSAAVDATKSDSATDGSSFPYTDPNNPPKDGGINWTPNPTPGAM
jgi:hypothetical protein